jgi:hypothetical protein
LLNIGDGGFSWRNNNRRRYFSKPFSNKNTLWREKDGSIAIILPTPSVYEKDVNILSKFGCIYKLATSFYAYR